jgi:pyruvate/2-oxoglutarate dehydrogenase complex dihydrolipoamide acyltransferase (E2) component
MMESTPIVLERENVNDETVTLVRWFAAHGDRVEFDALLAEVETSKANIEVHAPQAGFLVQECAQGAEIPVTAVIGHIAAPAPPAAPANGKVHETASQASPSPESAARSMAAASHAPSAGSPARLPDIDFSPAANGRQRFSPVAAAMMEQHRIPATAFAGKSVVRKQDVLDYLNPPAPPAPSPSSHPPRYPRARIALPYREVPLSKRKHSEAANLGAGMGNAVASSVSVICFTRGLRRILEAKLGGGNASAVMVFEVSRLLRKYPALNSVYRDGAMLQYEDANIGFAMDDGRGLKVAVLPDCDRRPLQDVAEMLHELAIAYVEDKLTPGQLANPTFTISDLSGLGVASFVPLISDGQCAILGIGGEQFAPGSRSGFFTLTLTFDHQISDGRTAALFLNDLKNRFSYYETVEQESGVNFVCSRCFRTAVELSTLDAHLLQLAGAENYLCRICAAGW